MTSATERLRALLTERGVEYTDRDMFGKHVFHWGVPLHGAMYTDAGEWTELTVENATPEQAVAATLGPGTCEVTEGAGHDEGWWVCSECGALFDTVESIRRDRKPNYCPGCGRKVEP